MNTHSPIQNLQRYFTVLAERSRSLGFLRLLPWVRIGEQLLQDEIGARRVALKQLDELQIATNPTARTDELYRKIREHLNAGVLLLLVGGLFFSETQPARRSYRAEVRLRRSAPVRSSRYHQLPTDSFLIS